MKQWIVILSLLSSNCLYCQSIRLNCSSCSEITCTLPTPSAGVNCTRLVGECGCCVYCARAEGQTCGGWQDIGGECAPTLKCTYRVGSIVGEHKYGTCETEKCSQIDCGYRQRCRDTNPSSFQDQSVMHIGPTCVCPNYNQCARKVNPVCGFDEVTYTSVCRLQEAECKLNRFIGIRQFGACPEKMTCHDCESDAIDTQHSMLCHHGGRSFTVGDKVPSSDLCYNLTCQKNGMVLAERIPGCGYGDHDPDYGVETPPVDAHWLPWSEWSSCDKHQTMSRTRSCVSQNEGRPCTNPIEQQSVTC